MLTSYYLRTALEAGSPIALPIPQSGIVVDLRISLVGATTGECTFLLVTQSSDGIQIRLVTAALDDSTDFTWYFHDLKSIYNRRDCLYLSNANPPALLPLTGIEGAEVDIGLTIQGVQW